MDADEVVPKGNLSHCMQGHSWPAFPNQLALG